MKSNYFIDTSLLKSLSIGIKEAIVLDFFYYYNNRNCKSYQISITKIAEHLNIARGHLYKILGELVKRELIVKSCREYIVTQNYISVRRKSFKEAHSNSQTSSDIVPNYVNKYSKTKQKIVQISQIQKCIQMNQKCIQKSQFLYYIEIQIYKTLAY